jgi:hypothetical protein
MASDTRDQIFVHDDHANSGATIALLLCQCTRNPT